MDGTDEARGSEHWGDPGAALGGSGGSNQAYPGQAGFAAPGQPDPDYPPVTHTPGYVQPSQPVPQPGYPQPGYPQPLPVAKLGGIPLRPLSLSDILDGAFGVIRRNPKATVGLAAAVGTVQAVITLLYQLAADRAINSWNLDDGSNGIDPTTGEPNFSGADLLGFFGGTGITFLLGLIFSAVLTGILCVAVSDDLLGHRASIGQLWTRVRPRLLKLVLLSVVVSVVPVLGLAPCLAPGVWLWGLWALAVPALMLEDAGFGGALGRSRALVAGAWWRVFGIRALGWLITFVMAAMLSAPFTFAAILLTGADLFDTGSEDTSDFLLFLIITAIGSITATAVTAPVAAGIDTLLYIDQRMRKEGLDIALQQRAVMRTQ